MTDQQTVLQKLKEDLESTEDRLLPEETLALSRARAKALSGRTPIQWRGFYPGMAILVLLVATAALLDKSFYDPASSVDFNQASTEPLDQATNPVEYSSVSESDDLAVYYWLAESSEELDELYGWNYNQ